MIDKTPASNYNFKNYLPLLIFSLILLVIIVFPLVILSWGFAPLDDALRHVAYTLSEKQWADILILRDQFPEKLDTHPGWHSILKLVNNSTNIGKDGLLQFSVISLWLFLAIPALFYIKKPEIFIGCLGFLAFIDFDSFYRLFIGRPYIFTISAAFSIYYIWETFNFEDNSKLKKSPFLILLFSLTTLAVWCHSGWYLFILPITGLLMTRKYQSAVHISAVIISGIFTGALLTGQPLQYLYNQVYHVFISLGSGQNFHDPVVEFRPTGFSWDIFILISLPIFFKFSKLKNLFQLNHPAFFVMILCWLLGFYVGRFWYDWGFPALLYWYSYNICSVYAKKINDNSPYRIVTAIILITIFLTIGLSKKNDHWSDNPIAFQSILNNDLKQDPAWLPKASGTVYSNSMGAFYNLFYLYPKADWKYLVGFEPGMMPEQLYQTYLDYRKHRTYESLLPWTDTMSSNDRLVVLADQKYKPTLTNLEWKFFRPFYWFGRIPVQKGKNSGNEISK